MTPGYKRVNGYLWPASDVDCMAVVFDTTSDLDIALNFVKQRNATIRDSVAIQAGGAQGVWANHLCTRFDIIYTFEPEPTNFACLCQNCEALNVIKMHAALGERRGTIGMEYPEGDRNMGACRIAPNGAIPIMRIDDLCLSRCDFIQLDIEGMEPLAIEGARETIQRCRPVLMIEDKGLSEHYGHPRAWTDKLPGYKVVARPNRDVILVPTDA